MKRLLSLTLSTALVLSLLAGCGGQTNGNTSRNTDVSSSTDVSSGDSGSTKLNYPTKPIELVVGMSAGGGTHLAAELLSPEAQNFLGQPLNITCKPGGGGAIGATYVAESAPDGYTLLYATVSLPTSLAMGDVEFAPEDLVGIARCSAIPPVLAVRSDAPYDNVEELVAWISEHPGEFSWAYPGVGSSLHLCGANALNKMGVADDIVGIPFDGTSEGIAAVLGGHVSAVSCFMSSLSEQIAAGEMKVLGVQDTVRLEDYPDIPTFLEQGVDATVTSWRGVFAPAGTPQEILDYLDEAFGQIIQTDSYRQSAIDLGEGVAYLNSTDFTAAYLADCEMVAPLVKELGLVE